MQTTGYAVRSKGADLEHYTLERRALRPNDVAIEILYCGVCHTDLHFMRDDWGATQYPLVPGHEIVGRVTATGTSAMRYRVGDHVVVGTMVDSCGTCDQCRRNEEQMCRETATATYNSPDRVTKENTLGGYSRHIVVREEFVMRLPEGLDASRAGPLVCAGITTYSPLRKWGAGPGSRVAVVGIGGLGHLAVRFAAALGATVTAIVQTEAKAADGRALGADAVLLSTSTDAMRGAASTFDIIIDTIPVAHDVTPYLNLLDIEGTLVILGAIGMMDKFPSYPLLSGRRRITGSPAGGIAETQEMLDFCAKKNILPECEIIAMTEINNAFTRMVRGDVRYRFVLDMQTLPELRT